MNNRFCHIAGAGDFYGIEFAPKQNDFVIAADGGLRYLEQEQIKVDLVIGDFDTLKCEPNHPNVIKLNSQKDDTDTLAAVREGIKLGYKKFFLYACTGGRIEHTIANIQVLTFLAENDMQGFLFDKENILTVITNKTITFPPHDNGFLSIFSLSNQSSGVFLKDVKYELNNATVTNIFPIGVSNEFIGKQSTITVDNGTLLIIFPKKYKEDILL